jgi:hypothetical protein
MARTAFYPFASVRADTRRRPLRRVRSIPVPFLLKMPIDP